VPSVPDGLALRILPGGRGELGQTVPGDSDLPLIPNRVKSSGVVYG
jgi:hypothetical protein